jgi:hypothetical protein
MKLRWRKHRCPSSVVLEIRIDGHAILGPIDAEQLGWIAKFGGGSAVEPFDLMGDCLYGPIERLEVLATYKS